MPTKPETPKPDQLFADPDYQPGAFRFDQEVVNVFPDMIKRSVPGYPSIIHLLGYLAERYAQANSHCYDLGVSLGAATLSMRHRIQQEGVTIIGVDNSAAMLAQCQNVIDEDSRIHGNKVKVALQHADINAIEISKASVVVLNFTLQFIPVEERNALLEKIYTGMNKGGVLLLSEKLSFESQTQDELMTEIHHDYKRRNGYSEMEIARKRNALENILIPETAKTHEQRMLGAGFNEVHPWFQCFNFASFLAFK